MIKSQTTFKLQINRHLNNRNQFSLKMIKSQTTFKLQINLTQIQSQKVVSIKIKIQIIKKMKILRNKNFRVITLIFLDS